MLDSARYDLTQVTLTSPIDGLVTRRNIEEGETVIIGTMNNPGTVLMTIADFSVLEAELEVDETDIPSVRLGQIAEITIDAFPDQSFRGRVTEIGNSPIQAPQGQGQGSSTQATNFKVVVTLDEEVPGVRPGFTCTADITTATRENALAVPIQATTVREVGVRPDGADRARRSDQRAQRRDEPGRGGRTPLRGRRSGGSGRGLSDSPGTGAVHADRNWDRRGAVLRGAGGYHRRRRGRDRSLQRRPEPRRRRSGPGP